jgi:hypothetical protein
LESLKKQTDIPKLLKNALDKDVEPSELQTAIICSKCNGFLQEFHEAEQKVKKLKETMLKKIGKNSPDKQENKIGNLEEGAGKVEPIENKLICYKVSFQGPFFRQLLNKYAYISGYHAIKNRIASHGSRRGLLKNGRRKFGRPRGVSGTL